MPRFIPLCSGAIVALLLSSFGLAQTKPPETIYYTNGRIVPARLVAVTEDSVRYRLPATAEGEVRGVSRNNVALIFRNNGEFLLPAQPDTEWRRGASPNFDHIVAIDGQVFPADSIQQYRDIIYYRDGTDSTDASIRTAETLAIIYRDGRHQLLANANEVASGLSQAVELTPPNTPQTDAVASLESIAAPLNRGLAKITPRGVASTEAKMTLETRRVADEAAPALASDKPKVEKPEESATSVAFPLGTSPRATEAEVRETLELDKVDYEEYATKALNKAEYLGYYLDLLCNPALDIYDKDQAIANALRLFVHDSTRVQVSSVTRNQTTTYRIKEYLQRLSLLSYDKVELVWRNLQYITKFRLAPDGNYYGTITVEQLFRGFRDGLPVYEDITQKDVEIVLGNFRKQESGTTEYAWDVFLSDIGVEETRRK